MITSITVPLRATLAELFSEDLSVMKHIMSALEIVSVPSQRRPGSIVRVVALKSVSISG